MGALLDRWVDEGRVGLVETNVAVTISRLDAGSVAELGAAAERLGWSFDLQDAAGEPAAYESADADFEPFVGTLGKPTDGADRRLLTCLGFKQALNEPVEGVWQIAAVRSAFVTGTASFNPWGHADVFSPSAETKSPLDLVREASEARSVPSDIRKWLLRGRLSEEIWDDSAFQVFAAASAPALIRSVSSEVAGVGTVIFSGPPRLSMALAEERLVEDLKIVGYQRLQAAVKWVYEDTNTAEQRHALFASEFARSVTRDEILGTAFQAAGQDVLDGARLAFQLSQSDLSREAIKAQGDLRRAIADDTSKAAEGSRTLAGAIAVAIATGITLVAARSTTSAEPWVLSLVAGVAAAYLLVVAMSGWAHLWLQANLRTQWRRRFYRFVPDEDYRAMVIKPARAAAIPYHLIGGVALIVSGILAFLAVTVWHSPGSTVIGPNPSSPHTIQPTRAKPSAPVNSSNSNAPVAAASARG
tara:strand:- start:724 stop:2139 length:1416 start_codon:yes stop_codon:yes gene_type:complete